MGICTSAPLFDYLAYPSYCNLTPATHDDQLLVLETWSKAVRTRPDVESQGEKAFDMISRKFYTELSRQNVNTNFPDDFLVCVVSTLAHGRHQQRAMSFRNFDFTPTIWNSIGIVLFSTVKDAYIPNVWTDEIYQAWVRCFGDLMREILSYKMFPEVVAPMSPSARHLDV